MNPEYILIGLLSVLAVQYTLLIISIRQLRATIKGMDARIQKFEERINGIGDNISRIYEKFKGFGSGKLAVSGSTPIGQVNLELELKQK